MIMTFIK